MVAKGSAVVVLIAAALGATMEDLTADSMADSTKDFGAGSMARGSHSESGRLITITRHTMIIPTLDRPMIMPSRQWFMIHRR